MCIIHEIGDRVLITDPKTRRETIGRVCDLDEKDGAVQVLVHGAKVWVRGDLVKGIEV